MIDVFLFAKAPRPGLAKTRLASRIGEENALRIYREMGALVARQIAPVSSITVWYDPPDALLDMRSWLGDHTYRPQPEGELGERLNHAFASHFAKKDAGPAVAIGTDAPGVNAETILRANEALQTNDVVLGPACDGGYYLIGLARHEPTLFTGIRWGTAEVFESTRAKCTAEGLTSMTLPTLRDVDTVEDLLAVGLWPLDQLHAKGDIRPAFLRAQSD